MCSGKKTSKEHVPARSFFPQEAEFRKNLITVPSCDLHNTNTSLDDEYVRNIIAMSFGNNNTAYRQFLDKVLKSLQESVGLMQATTGNNQSVTVNDVPTMALKIDTNRFNLVMRKIAYALYFHKFKKIWRRRLIVVTRHLHHEDFKYDEMQKLIINAERDLRYPTYSGHNPLVFRYYFGESEDANLRILRLSFYEGFEVWICPGLEEAEPTLENE